MTAILTTATDEIVFRGLIQDEIFVIETAARDLMHPSRTVNTTVILDARGSETREVPAGGNAFAHGLTLDQATAEAKIRAYLARTA
jgi:hypothetical protein